MPQSDNESPEVLYCLCLKSAHIFLMRLKHSLIKGISSLRQWKCPTCLMIGEAQERGTPCPRGESPLRELGKCQRKGMEQGAELCCRSCAMDKHEKNLGNTLMSRLASHREARDVNS